MVNQSQLRAKLIMKMRTGENLLQAQLNIQREISDMLEAAVSQVKDEVQKGTLR